MLAYTVKVKYAKGPEQQIAQFKQRDEAIEFIKNKLSHDAQMRVDTTYQLWELGELEKSFDQSSEKASSGSGSSDASSGGGPGGATSGQSFRPSPLQTSPRPKGLPANNWKDDTDDKKK